MMLVQRQTLSLSLIVIVKKLDYCLMCQFMTEVSFQKIYMRYLKNKTNLNQLKDFNVYVKLVSYELNLD